MITRSAGLAIEAFFKATALFFTFIVHFLLKNKSEPSL